MAVKNHEVIRNHAAFIWSVADLLRGDYKQSEYGKVILPLTVLRRLDCVLEPTVCPIRSVSPVLSASRHCRPGRHVSAALTSPRKWSVHQRIFEPSTAMRVLSTLSIGYFWLAFALPLAGIAGEAARADTRWLILEAVVLLFATAWPVQAWRGRVVVDDDAVTVRSGLGWTRRLRWEDIRRMAPPRLLLVPGIELTDGRTTRLGFTAPALGRSALRELARIINSRADAATEDPDSD